MPCYAVFQPTASVHTCALNGMADISSVADCQAALDYNNPLHTGSDGANCSTGYNCVVDGNGRHNLCLARHNYGLNCADGSFYTCGDSATSTGPGPASDCDGGSRTWNCVVAQDYLFFAARRHRQIFLRRPRLSLCPQAPRWQNFWLRVRKNGTQVC